MATMGKGVELLIRNIKGRFLKIFLDTNQPEKLKILIQAFLRYLLRLVK